MPYAALTAALANSRPKTWGWYILAAVATHAAAHWGGWPLSWIVLADLANVARALVATVLLASFFRGPPRLESLEDLLVFVLAAVLAAPAVGAAIGAANVVLHEGSENYWPAWQQWFMSNAVTGLIILPLFLGGIEAALRKDHFRVERQQLAELLLLAAALAVTCSVAFLTRGLGAWEHALPFYAPLPVLIWTALRFGPTAVSLALTAVAVVAVWGADRELGPFLASSPDENVLILQVFLLLTALPVLCLVVVSTGRRRALRLFGSLLASLTEQVAVLDSRGCVLHVNDSWRHFISSASGHEFTRADIGEDFLAICASAAEAGNAHAGRALGGLRSVLQGERRRFEMEYDQEREGRPAWYTLTIEALARPDGGAVVIRADISDSRRAQLEAEEQRRELSHLARVAMLGELSGGLAHELRQPLASIAANAHVAQRLLAREPLDTAELAGVLKDIISDDSRAAQVIDRLRALLRRDETNLQPVDSGELLLEVLELARMELSSRRVVGTASAEPGLPPVLADRVQIEQVLLNLLLNACDAMSETPVLERRIYLTAQRAGPAEVDLSIRDSGTGIPPGMTGRIFEPFVTTKPQGLGLGLSICRSIVLAHGGRLWAENNEDRGATVHCLLAAAVSPEVSPAALESGVSTNLLPPSNRMETEGATPR